MIPETWHDFPDDIKESVWAEASLTPLPKRTECFPELLNQRPAQQSREIEAVNLVYQRHRTVLIN